MFSKLGKKQKHILKMIVVEDYYILRTFDIRYQSTTFILTDDALNWDCSLSEKEFYSLWNRGFLLSEDLSTSILLEEEKIYLNEKFAEEALNAVNS